MKTAKRNKDFFEFPNKVLSQPQLIHPFPNDIHHLIATFMDLSYFLFVVPYRVIYNSTLGQYETRTNLLHKIGFSIVWSLILLQYAGHNLVTAIGTGRSNSLGVLRLLGGAGHLINILSFIFTAIYFRTKIVDLLNFLVIGGASHSSAFTSRKVISGSSIVKGLRRETPAHIYDNDDEDSQYQPQFAIWRTITFRKMSVVWWCVCIVMGIRSTTLLDRVFGNHDLKSSHRVNARPTTYSIVAKFAPNGFENFMVSGWSPVRFGLEALFIGFDVASEYHIFCAVFFGGLEVVVVLSLKFICSHFTNSLVNSKEFWKPSSNNVLSSFLVVRQACRRINKIFGWHLFFSTMGEFPNLTFFVVNAFKFPDASFQWSYRFGIFLEFFILLTASSIVIELSKLKDWLHFEEQPQRSVSGKRAFQKRIVLFELSLKRCAIFAHDFFQLSLPACVSILLGILSNALILIQMDLAAPSGDQKSQ